MKDWILAQESELRLEVHDDNSIDIQVQILMTRAVVVTFLSIVTVWCSGGLWYRVSKEHEIYYCRPVKDSCLYMD